MALSYLRRRHLDEIEDHFNEHGTFPEVLQPYVLDPEFKAALRARNLPIPSSSEANGLSPLQRAAIRLISDYHDKRPIRQKLKDLSATSTDYNSWLKIPAFRSHLEKAVDRSLSHSPLDSKLALSQLILDKDLNAIKYYNELTGIYRPNNETVLNLSLILSRLMDVLVKYLPAEQLSLVADELEMVVLDVREVKAIEPAR